MSRASQRETEATAPRGVRVADDAALPTAAGPTSNCGLTSATSHAPRAASASAAGNALASEMKLTSAVTESTSGGDRCSAQRARVAALERDDAWVRRKRHGADRGRRRRRRPCRPRASSTSVKPPVEAPTSSAVRRGVEAESVKRRRELHGAARDEIHARSRKNGERRTRLDERAGLVDDRAGDPDQAAANGIARPRPRGHEAGLDQGLIQPPSHRRQLTLSWAAPNTTFEPNQEVPMKHLVAAALVALAVSGCFGRRERRRRPAPRSFSSARGSAPPWRARSRSSSGSRAWRSCRPEPRRPNSGCHHVLIDTKLEDYTSPIPADDTHVHFGKGQTEAALDLKPGKHTLQLILADQNHIPHDPPVQSEVVTITVQ